MTDAPAGETFERLARAGAYPGDPSARAGVEWIQTHLSHVYRTAERVYKFRKAVALGFVNFEARTERNADCLREVALNRRLAPDVYLGVAPLREGPDGPTVGPPAEALADGAEHCVVMRRLPDGRDAMSLLARGRLTRAMLDRVAARIAGFHAAHGLGRPAPFAPEAWLAHNLDPVTACFDALDAGESHAETDALAKRARAAVDAFARQHADRFERRRRDGRAVDAHGDLHLQHVWFESDDAEPIAIDCLEFDESLRRIDVASEVAFLAMDLRYRGERGLAERFARSYAALTGDFDLYGVFDFYVAYRAAVRAKVAAIAASDRGIDGGQRADARRSTLRHLALAEEALASPSGAALLLVGGVVGTGKSTAAGVIADALDGVVIASDRLRKQLAGLDPRDRAGDGVDEGLYAPERIDAVYAAMLERAQPVVASGRIAILDATFGHRAHRERAQRWAREAGVPARIVEVRCAPEIAVARLRDRARTGRDPSDAGPELHATSAARFEPIHGELPLHVVRSDAPDWRERLAETAREWSTV